MIEIVVVIFDVCVRRRIIVVSSSCCRCIEKIQASNIVDIRRYNSYAVSITREDINGIYTQALRRP